jgi:hypothetical protein
MSDRIELALGAGSNAFISLRHAYSIDAQLIEGEWL